MGYDIYWDEEPLAVMEAQMEMRASGYEREASDEWSRKQHEHVSYWRESIWGIGGFRAVLLSVDAITDEDLGSDPDVPDEGDTPSSRRFMCNSGWWVTPQQCDAIASKLSAAIEAGELENLAFVKAVGRYGNEGDGALQVGKSIIAVLTGETSTPADVIDVPTDEELETYAKQVKRMVAFFKGAGEHGNGIRVH